MSQLPEIRFALDIMRVYTMTGLPFGGAAMDSSTRKNRLQRIARFAGRVSLLSFLLKFGFHGWSAVFFLLPRSPAGRPGFPEIYPVYGDRPSLPDRCAKQAKILGPGKVAIFCRFRGLISLASAFGPLSIVFTNPIQRLNL